MTGLTHAGAGVLVAHKVSDMFGLGVVGRLTSYGAGFIGSLLPDIDHKYSTINKILGTGWMSGFFGKHRTFTHTVWAVGGVYVLSAPVIGDVMSTSFVGGYISHLILDSLTFSRIEPLYPIEFKFGAGITKSGGDIDCILGIVLWAIFIALICKTGIVLSF